jgi:hypothetical protein
MTGEQIVMEAWSACEDFGKCGKFAGAVTVEIIKNALAAEGIRTSARDVFIKGLPIEIDLIVPRRGAEPSFGGVLYGAPEVAVALEIKKSGLYGERSLAAVRENFKALGAHGVACAYVTLGERQSYCYKATEENLGGIPCFTLCWTRGDGPLQETHDWDRLLKFLQSSGTQ